MIEKSNYPKINMVLINKARSISRLFNYISTINSIQDTIEFANV